MTTDPDKAKGFAPGKRVWLKDTWDAALVAKRLGAYATDMRVGPSGDKQDAYGRLRVVLGDGTPWEIRKDLLRLTPPPGLDTKREKAKASGPKRRKEAIAPEFGEEPDLLDLAGEV